MKFWNNPNIISKSPLVALICFEGANIGQIIRMLYEHAAQDQSLTSWIMVNIGLWIYYNFYRVCTPKEKFARFTAMAGIVINTMVISTVVYWRYITS